MEPIAAEMSATRLRYLGIQTEGRKISIDESINF